MKVMGRALMAVLVSAALACGGQEDSTDQGDTVEPVNPTANQEQVRDMLISDGLIAIPEVKAQSDHFVQQYRDGRMTKEEAAQQFRAWLQEWTQANPELAQQARERAAARRESRTASPPATDTTSAE